MPLTLVEDDVPALSAARARLAECIAALEKFRTEQAELARPAEKLRSFIAERRQAATEKAERRASEREALVAAMARGEAVDLPGPETVEHDDGIAAAEEALRRADAAHQTAVLRSNSVITERATAVLDVLIEAVAGLANTELRAAIIEQRRVEAKIRSLLAYFERGRDTGQAGHGAAAERAGRLIREARQAIPQAPPSRWVDELAAGLATDATCGLAHGVTRWTGFRSG
jgi:hypothetical protein